MRYAVWMNAWDVGERESDELLDFLQDTGLNGCNLGLTYHGGRMLLPAHPSRVVYEHRQDDAPGCEPFLRAAARRRFDARAWVVLCHNDDFESKLPRVVNAFGEAYPYAFCPAQPAVQEYCVDVCRRAAAMEGVRGLDIEALSFLGYEHGGLHDKRGVPVPAEAAAWLSVCCCEVCSAALPGIAHDLQSRIRAWLGDPYAPLEEFCPGEVLAWRHGVQADLLRRIRTALPGVVMNVRLSPEPRFSGGKCSLPVEQLIGLADEVTYTSFGAAVAQMELPVERPLPAHCGFVFHEPDSRCEEDVARRLAAVPADGWGFYSFGMAARPHWRWLKQALKGSDQ